MGTNLWGAIYAKNSTCGHDNAHTWLSSLSLLSLLSSFPSRLSVEPSSDEDDDDDDDSEGYKGRSHVVLVVFGLCVFRLLMHKAAIVVKRAVQLQRHASLKCAFSATFALSLSLKLRDNLFPRAKWKWAASLLCRTVLKLGELWFTNASSLGAENRGMSDYGSTACGVVERIDARSSATEQSLVGKFTPALWKASSVASQKKKRKSCVRTYLCPR